MRYSDIKGFVQSALTAKDYGVPGGPAMPLFDPGPVTLAKLRQRSPNAMVFLQVGNGVGLRHEGIIDSPFITVRVVGPQHNYTAAETLAYDVDDILLGVGGNTTIGTAKVLFITRSGGAPMLIDFDAADRYSFQTTYITEAVR